MQNQNNQSDQEKSKPNTSKQHEQQGSTPKQQGSQDKNHGSNNQHQQGSGNRGDSDHPRDPDTGEFVNKDQHDSSDQKKSPNSQQQGNRSSGSQAK